jgi:hypothetical protein
MPRPYKALLFVDEVLHSNPSIRIALQGFQLHDNDAILIGRHLRRRGNDILFETEKASPSTE